MKFNKLILICLLLLAIVSFGAVSASDNLTVETASDDLVVEDNFLQATGEEIVKDESSSIVVTNETFTNYFDGEGRLSDSVPEGSTLDFQGLFEESDNIKSIYINKPVNIISSTKDATITLNTKDGKLGIGNITNRFIVDNVSSITIKDITFNRTQIIIHDSSNVVLDDISVISDDYKIIDSYSREISFLKIQNVNKFALKNSYFYVFNIGSSFINCNETRMALFDNNTFCGYADSGENGKSFMDVIVFSYMDTSVNITNNKVHANAIQGSNFGHIKASNILFENNTVEHPTEHIVYSSDYMHTYLGESGKSNTIVRNNTDISLDIRGNSTIYNNKVQYFISGERILAYNNTAGSLSMNDGSIAYNNTITGGVQIRGDNVILKDSTMGSLSVPNNDRNITIEHNIIGEIRDLKSSETFVLNNIINGQISISYYATCEIIGNVINGGIGLSSRLCIIRDNVINSPTDYAIGLGRATNIVNNEISGNKLYSRLYCGDNAVFYDETYTDNVKNYIYGNTPETQIGMFLNTTVNAFDYGENTTIVVNMPNVEGNVNIDVDGENYVVELVNGSASQVIPKYSLGINNVTAIYYDSVNDVWAINHTEFTVNKVIYCPMELIYDCNLSEGKVSSFNVILPDDANGTIFITLSNGIYNLEVVQTANGGKNKITLPGLFEGNHTMSVTFSSIKYVTNSTFVNISVVHIPVYELTANDIVMDYKDGSKYKVLVTKDGKIAVGEIVKINFNGKANDVKTDNDGYATLTLDAAPKTYTISAVCNGITKSSKVTIKNILKASNVSKKKAKTIKFSATLKTSKGKAITGKKITFKLKGKTYTAKTNKKGVATISIKNLKVGKYTITSKYGECTVKNTIKIKK